MLSRALFIVSLVGGSLSAAGLTLSPSGGVLVMEDDPGGQPIPRYGYGFTVGYDSSNSAVYLYDDKGQLLFRSSVAIPDATRIFVREVAASANGVVAVSVGASDRDGRLASFLLWLDHSGRTSRAVRTTPYTARRLVFDKAGTLWAFGRVRTESFEDEPGHDMVRRYAANGVLTQSLLPRDQFPSLIHPSMASRLVVGDDRIGVLSGSAGQYAEFSLDGKLLVQRPFVLGSQELQEHINGAALLGDDHLCVSSAGPRGQNETFESPVYCQEKASGAIEMVDSSAIGADALLIMGADSTSKSIVLLTKSRGQPAPRLVRATIR